MTRRRAYLAGLIAGGVCWTTVMLGLAIYHVHGGRFYWTEDVSLRPSGLYRCQPWSGELEPGMLVSFRPPAAQEALVYEVLGRQKLPALWMKQVVGRVGQTVCLQENTVTVEETVVATRPLVQKYPHRDGCWTLQAHEVFVLGNHPRSWDSRYFGPIERATVQGQCQAVWTWEAK